MPYYRGKRVSAEWLVVLRAAEKARGRPIQLNSGQRTMAEQQYLYDLYRAGRGNLAARPSPWAPHIRVGRPDHALDVEMRNGDHAWLDGWCTELGYPLDNTVPGEGWHKEIRGGASALRALAKKVGDDVPVLRRGQTGPSVIRLKKLMHDRGLKGFGSRFNPYFNEATEDAIRRFQRARKVTADGVVGPATWRALRA